MTGTVKSEIAKLDRSLPSDSIYTPIKDAYARRLTFSQDNNPMETSVYARKLVREALKGEGWLWGLIGASKKWFWAGGLVTQVWLARLLFGEWLLDQVTYRRFDLHKLEGIVRKERAKKID